MVSSAGANDVAARARTSTITTQSWSRQTRSSSPSLQRKLRARIERPRLSRYRAATASQRSPRRTLMSAEARELLERGDLRQGRRRVVERDGPARAELSERQQPVHPAVGVEDEVSGHAAERPRDARGLGERGDEPIRVEAHAVVAQQDRAGGLRPVPRELAGDAGAVLLGREQPRSVREHHAVQVVVPSRIAGLVDSRRRVSRNVAREVEAQLRREQPAEARVGGEEDHVDVLASARLELERDAEVRGEALITLIAAGQVQERGDRRGEILLSGIVAAPIEDLSAEPLELGPERVQLPVADVGALDERDRRPRAVRGRVTRD